MRQTYTFEDLVKVWKAAELNARLTGVKWDNSLDPTHYCTNRVRGRGFITLEHFGQLKLLFRAMLPSLTQKNMKQILRDLRKREKEFSRREDERRNTSVDGDHTGLPKRYVYDNWKLGARKHALIPGRLYPLRTRQGYTSALRGWITRLVREGKLEPMVETLREGVRRSIKENGFIDVGTSSATATTKTWKAASALTDLRLNSFVKLVVEDNYTSYDKSRIAREIELRCDDHLSHTVWGAPYKTTAGRAGLLLCIKLPQYSSDYCWKEEGVNILGSPSSKWIYRSSLLLNRGDTVAVSRPEVIEDWDEFIRCERAKDGYR